MKSMRLCATLILSAVTVASLRLAAQNNPSPPLIHPSAEPATTGSGPLIQVDGPSYDFGKIPVGEKARHTYIVTNTGNEPLLITNVHPGCHCTTAGDWSHTVAPGQTGQIPVQFDSTGFSGPITRTIDVYSNAKNEPRKTLMLKGAVWKPIEVTPTMAVISIPSDSTNAMSTTVRLVNGTQNPVTISNPVSANHLFTVELKETKPGKEYELIVTTQPPYTPGNSMGTITVNTSLATVPVLSIPVTASVPQPVQIFPAQITLNTVQNHWVTNRVTIHGNTKNALVLSNPKSSDSRVLVELQPMAPAQGMFNVQVAFPPNYEVGPGQTAEVTIESDNPRFPLIHIPIKEYPRSRPVGPLAARPVWPPAQTTPMTNNAALTHQNPPPPAAHP